MWQPRQWFKDRYSYSPAALDRPVPIIVLGLFTIVAAWDAFVAQFLPKECADELPTVYDVAIMTGGLLPWYWWVIVGLTLLLGIVFEYSFRQRHSRRHTISTQAQSFWQAEERWLNVPGVGREAARLIMMAPTFDDARAVHDTFLAVHPRTEPWWAHYAILYRMEMDGLEDEVIAKAAEISGETGDAFIVDAEDEYAKALRLYYETR